jgi:hypothetical protein
MTEENVPGSEYVVSANNNNNNNNINNNNNNNNNNNDMHELTLDMDPKDRKLK